MLTALRIDNPSTTPCPWWEDVAALRTHTSIEFGPGLNILWGPNGSGKSTVLKVIAALTHCAQGGTPLVTSCSVRALRDKTGAWLGTDGQPVHYLAPETTPGLIGGSFDYDFMEAGVFNAVQGNRLSQGQWSTASMGRVMAGAAAVTPTSKVPGKPSYTGDEGFARFLRPTVEESGRATVLMDEPDRSLDLPGQAKLWLALTAQPRFQLIVATHCPFALGIPSAHYIDVEPGYRETCEETLDLMQHWRRMDENPHTSDDSDGE